MERRRRGRYRYVLCFCCGSDVVGDAGQDAAGPLPVALMDGTDLLEVLVNGFCGVFRCYFVVEAWAVLVAEMSEQESGANLFALDAGAFRGAFSFDVLPCFFGEEGPSGVWVFVAYQGSFRRRWG